MENVASLSWWPAQTSATDKQVMDARAGRAATVSDEALMQRYRDGDDEAFRCLYSRHRGALLRFARHLSGHASDADEIFQETWISVIHARSRYTASANFVTWLFSIAHRRAVDGHRRRARRPATSGTDAAMVIDSLKASAANEPAEIAMATARQCALDMAIAALPFEQREVFLLRAETALGVRDIATLTHTNPETTKSRLRYALRTLRKSMEPWS